MVPGIVEPCGDSKHYHRVFDAARHGGWLGNYAGKWESIYRNRRDDRFVARRFYCDSEVPKLSAQTGRGVGQVEIPSPDLRIAHEVD